MALNELDRLQQGQAPAQANEYDSMIADDKATQKQAVQGAMYVADKTQPARTAEVLNISKKMNLPPDIVERNFDDLNKKANTAQVDYDAMIDQTPGLAKWLEDPNNAALGKDDLDPLGQMDRNARALSRGRDGVQSMGQDLFRAGETGYRGMESSAWHLAAAYGLTTPEEAANQVAVANQRSRDLRALMPDYARDFNEVMAKESGDVNKAFKTFTGSYQQAREGQILQALRDFATGGVQTVGEAIDMIGAAAYRPRGLMYASAENLVNSAPALVTGLAGAKAGAMVGANVGAVVGSVVPGVGTLAGIGTGTAVGGMAGMAAGSFAGAVPVEIGSWINQELEERGVNTTDPQAIAAAYRDSKMMADIRAEAERKGVTTAGVDALFNAFAGRLAGRAGEGGVLKRAGHVAADMGVQATGEVASEYAGQVAAKKGLEGTSFGDAIQEGIISLGHSAAETSLGAASARVGFSKNPVRAAEEIHAATENAMHSVNDVQTLAQIGEAAKKLKNTQLVPGKIAEMIDGGGASPVYFQTDDWDQYWSKKGQSPAKAAEQILGDGGKKYVEAKQTGTPLEIPMGQFVEQTVKSQDFDGLLGSAKTSADGMSLNEAKQHMAALPATMQELAKEVAGAPAATAEESAAQVGNTVRDQLKAIGVDPEQAVLYEEGFRVLGERSGIDPLELFNQTRLRITDQQVQSEGQTFDQATPSRSITFPVRQQDGIFSVSPRDDMSAAARLVDGQMQIDSLQYNPKYMGVTQDMIRSLERTAVAGGAFSMSARPTAEDLIAAYRAQGFEDQGDGVMFKDLSASRIYNQDSDASRKARAQAMGYDTTRVLYHSSEKSFKKMRGSKRGALGPGVYTYVEDASNVNAVEDLKSEYGPKLYEMYRKAGKSLESRSIHSMEQIEYAKGVLEELGLPTDIPQIESAAKKAAQGRDSYETAYSLIHDAAVKKFGRDEVGVYGASDFVDKMLKDAGYVSVIGTLNDNTVEKVIDPADLKSIDAVFKESGDLYNQNEGDGPLGQIHFGEDGTTISILKGANASTFFHETGHFYLETLKDLAGRENMPDQIKQDYQTIRDWLGVKDGAELSVENHEQFARGFEAYLMDGKAPSSRLVEAFARFKVWLLSVYKKMRPNVEFSKEVRDVMNRVFATDEEIRATEGDYPALIEDPASLAMSEAQFKKYTEAKDAAKLEAEEALTRKLIDDFRRQEKAFYKEKRVGVRAEVEQELKATREYKALEILQSTEPQTVDGQETFKISKQSLKDIGATDMPRGISADDGLHVELAAPALGFLDGAGLVRAMQNLPKLSEAVERITDKRMAEYYPDSLVDGTLQAETIKAIHNDKRAELLRMELQLLAENDTSVLKDVTRRITRRPPTREQVRSEAVRIIGSTKVNDVRPYLYQRAEVKAAKEAGEALTRGDLDAAFEAKQRELLNHELYRESLRAQQDIKKATVSFRRFNKTDEKLAKTRDMNLVDTGRAILASFNLGPPSADSSTAQDILDKIRKYDPENYETAKALYDMATENGTADWKTISFDDFTAIQQSVDALWDLAKSTKEILLDGRRESLETAKSALIGQASKFIDPKARAEYTETAGPWQKTKSKLLSAKADLVRVEHWAQAMDVNGNQEFTKTIFRPISEAVTKYRLEKGDYMKRYESIIRAHEGSMSRDPIVSPEIRHRFKNKAELLTAILHTGNESNMRKLLVGRGWGSVSEDGRLNRTNWDQMITRLQAEGVLTKADYDFCQQIWDLMEDLKPKAQTAHKEMHGYFFKEITTDGISTPFGDYRGGYIPARLDVNESEDADIRREREDFEKNNNSYQFPTTGRGFTKSRVEQYAGPLSLDMNLLGNHIDQVLRFINIEPRVKEVSRIVMDKEFRAALREVDPSIAKDALIPWLQRAAQQKVVLPSRDGLGRLTDALASNLRHAAAVQMMFGNVTNTLQQITGLAVAAVKVKPRHLRNAFVNYFSDIKGFSADIMDRSDWMRSTQGSNIYETSKAIQSIIVQPSTFESMKQFVSKHTYFLQSATQNFVNNVVWAGAYDQAIESGVSEAEAVKQADAAVRTTQGSVNPEDVSRFETGTQTERLFKQFVGYFNMLANLNGFEIQKISRSTGLRNGAGRAFYVYMMGVMIPAVASELIVRAMSGKGFDEDDDDSYLDDAMSAFFGSQFKTITAAIPYGGQVAVSAYNRFNDQRYDDRLSLSPVVSLIEGTAGVPFEIYKNIAEDADNEKRIAKDVLTLVGLMSSLPSGPIGKPVGYLMDVNSGRAEPTGPVDFTRGLITGKSGQ